MQHQINKFRDYYYSDDGAWLDIVGKVIWRIAWLVFWYWLGITFLATFANVWVTETLPEMCALLK